MSLDMSLNRRYLLTGASALAVTGVALSRAAAAPQTTAQTSGQHAPLDPSTRAGRIAWLEKHAAALRSIDIEDDDFYDLAAFAAAVGNARVVMLGEQTHGDGTTFRAKARLVRFLHKHMGFDVLAFESGLYNMAKVWKRIRDGEDATEAAGRGMSSVWSQSEQIQPLIEYVGARAGGARPLELAGFDCQFTGSDSKIRVLEDLSEYFEEQEIDVASIVDWSRYRELFDDVTDPPNDKWRLAKDQHDFMLAAVDALIARIPAAGGREAAFWRQLLKSSKATVNLRALDLTDAGTVVKALNHRDAAMADNLLWLAREVYPERKIVVWAATSHVYSDPNVTSPDGRTNMGSLVTQALGPAVYKIGFTTYEGERSFVRRDMRTIAPPPPDSLEGLWGETEHDYGFLDLKRMVAGGEWLQAPFASRLLSADGATLTREWSKFVDAFVFLHDMQPSTSIE